MVSCVLRPRGSVEQNDVSLVRIAGNNSIFTSCEQPISLPRQTIIAFNAYRSMIGKQSDLIIPKTVTVLPCDGFASPCFR